MADPASYVNALGVVLTTSGAYTGIVSTAATVTGTSGADGLRGIAATAQTLAGGAGNDTYFVTAAATVVVEAANGGVDTVRASVSHTLEANVENLTLDGGATSGTGNALANIVVAGAGAQTLDGGGGDDVLVGGAGGDTFVEGAGSGRDAIVDFQTASDHVRVQSATVTSFAQVQAAMTQAGADVSLDLGAGDGVVFRAHQVADFSATDFQFAAAPIVAPAAPTTPTTPSNPTTPATPAAPASAPTPTFDQEFSGALSLDTGQGGVWRPTYGYGGASAEDNRHLNDEAQVYVDPTWTGTDGKMTPINPFSVSGGVLSITETRLTAAQSAENWGLAYASGLLTTKGSFSQAYGYFEIGAKLPAGQGMWPAFWLLPTSGAWPPELDVFEELGKDPTTAYQTAVTGTASARQVQQTAAHTADVTVGFHRFGLLWTATDLVWYVDGVETAHIATPAAMNTPMYLIVNLAVGGAWGGGVTAATPSGASLQVDYVRAYSAADAAAALAASNATSPAIPTTPPAPAVLPDTLIAGARLFAGTAATDHFTLQLKDLDAAATGVQALVTDFAGAGRWTATNNDWLTLSGFSAGTTFAFDHASTVDPTIGVYALHDAASDHTFLVGIRTADGAHLAASDFGIY